MEKTLKEILKRLDFIEQRLDELEQGNQ